MVALAAALVSAVLVPGVGLAAGHAAATSWTVNDDTIGKRTCKSPDFNTIQAAVDAAAAGDNILVCSGVYGATTVDKELSITGAGVALKTKKCLDAAVNPATGSNATIVSGGISPGFSVGADNVTISDLTIQDSDIGLRVTGDAVSATTLTNSVLQNNTMGVYLRGQDGSFTDNCLRTNNRAGSASGNGMYTDPNVVFQGGKISTNTFLGNTSTAINLNGDGSGSTSSLLIKNNYSQNDGDFVSLAGTSAVKIQGNMVPEMSGGSVVFVQDSNFELKILNNTFSGGEEGVNFNANGNEPNLYAIVSGNTLTNNGFGIVVIPESLNNGLLYKNTVKGNAFGILLAPANYVQVVGNTVKGNSEIDCADFNPIGEFTLWHANVGNTQNQDGLCDGAVTLP
jgi:parallel beta-helix repeat protein